MFAVLTTSRGKYTINLAKVLFFYEYKKGTRVEMEDGTIIDVEESVYDLQYTLSVFDAIPHVSALKN